MKIGIPGGTGLPSTPVKTPGEAITEPPDCSQAASDLARIGSLVGALDHDLRNALNVVKTAIFYLQTRLADEDARILRQMELADTGSVNAVRLLAQVADFTLGLQRPLRNQAIMPIVYEALQALGPLASRIDLESDRDLPDILADAESLKQAIALVAQRGLERSRLADRIRLSVRSVDGRIRLAFEDNGPALSSAQREALFQRPHQPGIERSRTLSNALAREIVNRLGGRIFCEARDDRGCRVVMELPEPT